MKAVSGSRDGRVLLAMLAFSLTAGSAFMFVKLLVGELTPLQVAAGRVALAAPPLLVLMALAGSTPRLTRPLLAGATLLALMDTIAPYVLIAWSQQRVASSTAALLVSTMPLFTTLIAARSSRDEGLSATAWLGVAAGFLGVIVLAGPDALDFGHSSGPGVLAVVLAAFCYALGAVYSRGLLRHADPLGLSAVKLSLAACLLLPAVTVTGGLGGFGSLSHQGWLGLVAVGCLSTGLARSVYQWVIATAGSVRASLVTYVIPVVALVLGWAFLHEQIHASTLAGAALIVSGIALSMYGGQVGTWLRARAASFGPRIQAQAAPVVAFRDDYDPDFQMRRRA